MRYSLSRFKLPLYLLLEAFAIWLVVAAILIALFANRQLTYLGWAILALIGAASFAWPPHRIGLLATALGVLVYLILGVLQSIPGRNYFPAIFASALSFIVSGLLGQVLQERVYQMELELRHQGTLIGELTIRDSVTGAIKWQYARQLLIEEVERSRRYNHSLSLVLVGIEDWPSVVERVGKEEAKRLLSRTGESLVRMLRTVDKVCRYGASEFALILPDTPLVGAEIAVGRVCAEVMRQTQLLVRAGIAHFPSGATSSEELINETEAALGLARTSGLPIVSQSLLGKAQ